MPRGCGYHGFLRDLYAMNDLSITKPTPTPLAILHLAPLEWGRITGLNSAILALIQEQNLREDTQAALVLTGKAPDLPSDASFPVFDRRQLFRMSEGTGLRPPFDRPHLAVFHSLYIPAQAVIARRFHKACIPYVICPHGGMTVQAQAHHKWKKRIGNFLLFNRFVDNAVAIQHLTSNEAAVSKGWNRSVFIIGNGIHPPADSDLASPGQTGNLRFAFLGRLAIEHKGLDLLLEACSLIRPALLERGVQIGLYGPDQSGSTQLLKRRIAELKLTDTVFLKEAVLGQDKSLLLQHTDVFVHTSRWEGHSIAVLEALSYGIPCLLTPGTNMAEEVAAAEAGWQVASSPHAIADGLQRILTADRKTLELFGANARQLALQKYAWKKVADRTIEAYRQHLV